MSQREVAERAGVHKNTVQRWESGAETDPQAVQVVAVARALETSVEWLREGGSEKPPIVVQVGVVRAEGRGAAGGVRESRVRYNAAGSVSRAREILEEIQELQLELSRELRALENQPATSPPGAVTPAQAEQFLAEEAAARGQGQSASSPAPRRARKSG